MKETFDHRKTELEIAAKNTIVEIHLIKEKQKEIKQVLEVKERHLLDINASLRELDHLNTIVEIGEGSDPD